MFGVRITSVKDEQITLVLQMNDFKNTRTLGHVQ